LNLRLHPHEIMAIVKHAGDRFLIMDDVVLPIFQKVCSGEVPFEKIIVVPYVGDAEVPPDFLKYEELLAKASDDFRYPKIDENDGAAMCYTSGTTGNSKGVIYSHRALVLHSFAEMATDSFGVSHHETVLPIAPMFHANAWGLPYACTMAGARLIFPGPHVDAESVLDLMQQEHVTIACGVPTVWLSVLYALEKNPGRWKFDWPVRLAVGGTAPPERLMRALDKHNLHILHLWGMTETTPLATVGKLKRHMRDWTADQQYEVRAKQGRTASRWKRRATGSRQASWKCAGRGWREVITTRWSRRGGGRKTGGSRRATWPRWTTKASSKLWIARRTW
jgi:fatty-acyl-CoA synthase